MSANFNSFGARDTFSVNGKDIGIFRLSTLQEKGLGDIDKLPYSIRVLLESVLRNCDGQTVTEDDVKAVSYTHLTLPTKRIV